MVTVDPGHNLRARRMRARMMGVILRRLLRAIAFHRAQPLPRLATP